MKSIEEKQKFVRTIIHYTPYGDTAQKRLHSFLLEHTNRAKLYKYRSVNDNNLKCLADGTMYCAISSEFNDPFDSKLGYSLQDAFDTKYRAELERLDAILNRFVLVREGKLSIDSCTVAEKNVIKGLLSNTRLMNIISNNRGNTSYADVQQLINDNPWIIWDIVSTVLMEKSFACKFPVLKQVFEQKKSQEIPSESFLKDKESVLEDRRSFNGMTEDTDEVGRVLLLSRILMPSDKVDSIQKELERVENGILKLTNSFRIGCLATDYKNRLMWAHYSNSYSGYCVEYDFSGTDSFTMKNLPLPILYSTERPRIPWEQIKPSNKAKAKRINSQVLEGLLTKDKIWEYEDEWRVLINSADKPVIKMPPITCVYLGANMIEKERDKVIKIAKEKNYKVKQMRVDRGTYNLHAEEILSWD